MPLIELEPPSVRPRGHSMRRSPVPCSGSVVKFQLTSGLRSSAQHAGRDVDHRMPVGRPGLEQDDARAVLAQPAATTQPAEPAPTTT